MSGWKLKQLGYDVEIIEPAIASKPDYLYVHKKHTDLVPKIVQILKQLRLDGTLDAIYTRVALNR